jgi:hypothetical protein
MNERRCPYCDQALPNTRLGVKVGPVKARLFDLIQRGGEDGVTNRDLSDILGIARETVKAHVFQLNEHLAGTDYQIKGGVWGYRLVREEQG